MSRSRLFITSIEDKQTPIAEQSWEGYLETFAKDDSNFKPIYLEDRRSLQFATVGGSLALGGMAYEDTSMCAL
ncbi:hypothetical protein AVEN_205898-1 [Araneus ventricosus]|uniref:Uncharacterized protein n=1 Tax=Araneus ventricosus TaxID=182803 RepID=A0A4Y2M3C9_ARAVE|nr:hypothetical protein AVEN_205898-1 [Araneus ventricosus]